MERRCDMAIKATFETDGKRYRLVKVISRKPSLTCGEEEVEVGSFVSLEQVEAASCEYTIKYKERRLL
jgi:hypothetical protein